MKLLLDENLSRRLVPLLANAYPDSTHVVLQGLQQASDGAVWQYAKDHDYVIVSKDDDFTALSSLRGRPPCLIKLSLGNCDNEQVLQVLLARRDLIETQIVGAGATMVELVFDLG